MLAPLVAFYRARSHKLGSFEKFDNSYTFVILRAIDILAASLLWRNYGVTISAYTGLAMRAAAPSAWAILLGAALVAIQKNHCEQAIVADVERASNAIKMLLG